MINIKPRPPLPPDIEWYYHGRFASYGFDSERSDVCFDYKTLKVRRIYSQNQLKEMKNGKS